MSKKESIDLKVDKGFSIKEIQETFINDLNSKTKSKKKNITFYLASEKIEALNKFCDENDIAKSIVIESLIDFLIQ